MEVVVKTEVDVGGVRGADFEDVCCPDSRVGGAGEGYVGGEGDLLVGGDWGF